MDTFAPRFRSRLSRCIGDLSGPVGAVCNRTGLDTFAPPVGAVCNRTGLECLINSRVHYNSPVGACIPIYRGGISESRHLALGPTFLLQLFKQIGFDPDLSGMVKKPRLILRVSANPVPLVPM